MRIDRPGKTSDACLNKATAGLLLAIGMALQLTCCGGSQAAQPDGRNPAEASVSIGPGGGTVEIPGVVSIEFPAGAFLQPTTVTAEIRAADDALMKEYEESSSMSSAGPTDGNVLIVTSPIQPSKESKIKYKASPEFLAALGQKNRPIIFGKFLEYGADEEELEDFINLGQSTANDLITAIMPRALFTSGWTQSSGTSQAILILGSRPISSRTPAKSGSFFLSAAARATCGGNTLSSPLSGDLAVTSPFGERLHPISGQQRMHYGIDLRAQTGDVVFAAAEGTVSAIGFNYNPTTGKGYGRYIVILHSDGSKTKYAHLEERSTDHLRIGDSISRGDVIGKADTTGGATGPHLHFEYDIGTSSDDETRIDPFNCIVQSIRILSTTIGNPVYWPLFEIPFDIDLDVPESNYVNSVECVPEGDITPLEYGCAVFNIGSGTLSGQINLLDPRGNATAAVKITDSLGLSQSITISDSWDCCESNDTAHYMGVIRSCIALGDTIATTLCPVL